MTKTFLSFFLSILALNCIANATTSSSSSSVPKIANIDTHLAKFIEKSIKIHDSLEYWQQEKFYQNLPFYRKTPDYWISNSPEGDIDQHILTLQELHNYFNTYIGMILHLQFLYNMPTAELSPEDIELLNTLEKSLPARLKTVDQFNSVIQAHQKPSHFMINKWSYATAIGATALTWYWYQNMPKAQNETSQPLALVPFDKPADIKIQPSLGYIAMQLYDSLPNLAHRVTKEVILPYTAGINEMKNNSIDWLNANIQVINGQIKNFNQDLQNKKSSALKIAGITAATIGLYAGYKKYQNSFYKKPMKNLFHKLHKTLTSMNNADNQYQYNDIGFMYALCSNIEQYLGMLSNHDLYEMSNDLKQLKSLHISVNHKINLINHMYLQYNFLR